MFLPTHRWLASTYPNDGGWKRIIRLRMVANASRKKIRSTGRFGMTGASGAIYPEEYNQHGSLWDHLVRNKKEFTISDLALSLIVAVCRQHI